MGTLLIQVNGESREVMERATLSDLVAELSLTPARIAVELNHQVVRRDKWLETFLSQDDRIEIVHFVGGGMGEDRFSANENLISTSLQRGDVELPRSETVSTGFTYLTHQPAKRASA